MPLLTDNITSEGLLDTGVYRVQTLVQATANSTLNLTLASAGYMVFTGTAAGQIVKFGAATTYLNGHTYLIHNKSTQRITVQDNAGNVLCTVYSNYRSVFVLHNNTTAAGEWAFGLNTSTDSFWVFENGLLTWEDGTGADLFIKQIGGSGSAYVRQGSANGTLASPTATTTGQRLGGYGYYGYNSSGWNGLPSAEDLITASEDHTPTAWGGDREWNTILNGTTLSVERMRLTNDGNLLIGTTENNGIDRLQLDRPSSVNFSIQENYDDLSWTTLGATSNPHSVVGTVANGGVVTPETTATSNDYFGRVDVTTGVTSNATGRAALDYFNALNKIRLGNKRIFFESRVMVPVLSNTGGITYTVYCGLQAGTGSGLPTNGVFFTYTHSTNSGQWVPVCRSSSTSSSPSNPIPVTVVAGTWYVLRAEINSAGTSVSFFINGLSVGDPVTTFIPSSTTGLRPVFKIEKNSSTTTSRTLSVDSVYWKMFR